MQGFREAAFALGYNFSSRNSPFHMPFKMGIRCLCDMQESTCVVRVTWWTTQAFQGRAWSGTHGTQRK